MSKGKAKTNYLHREGLVGHSDSPDWSFIYETSTIKDSKWNIGDRVVLGDGREYRYAKSDGICYAGQACEFTATGYSAICTADTPQAIGDKQVSISAAATHAIIAEDGLRGGFVVIHNSDANAETQVRGIIGNDAVTVADSGCVLYLDGPLTTAITVADSDIEVFENPYAAVHLSASGSLAKAGVPAVYVKAALMYFWVQVKGPCFLAATASVNTNDIGCGFRHDGALDGYNHLITNDIDGVGEETSQYAGYRLLGNQTGNGPLFMLTL